MIWQMLLTMVIIVVAIAAAALLFAAARQMKDKYEHEAAVCASQKRKHPMAGCWPFLVGAVIFVPLFLFAGDWLDGVCSMFAPNVLAFLGGIVLLGGTLIYIRAEWHITLDWPDLRELLRTAWKIFRAIMPLPW